MLYLVMIFFFKSIWFCRFRFTTSSPDVRVLPTQGLGVCVVVRRLSWRTGRKGRETESGLEYKSPSEVSKVPIHPLPLQLYFNPPGIVPWNIRDWAVCLPTPNLIMVRAVPGASLLRLFWAGYHTLSVPFHLVNSSLDSLNCLCDLQAGHRLQVQDRARGHWGFAHTVSRRVCFLLCHKSVYVWFVACSPTGIDFFPSPFPFPFSSGWEYYTVRSVVLGLLETFLKQLLLHSKTDGLWSPTQAGSDLRCLELQLTGILSVSVSCMKYILSQIRDSGTHHHCLTVVITVTQLPWSV